LKAAGIAVQDLKDANRQVADIVLEAARPPVRTGRLAGSGRAAGTQAAAIVRAGGARVPYAGPIHWGWGARNIRANPWVQEAAESTEARWAAEYQQHIDAIIRAVEGATP
jgi:hypothetical protein